MTSVFSISCAAAATRSTASSNASWFNREGLFIPESFLTNCRADAITSSLVAGGSKLDRVLMLRHIAIISWIQAVDSEALSTADWAMGN